MKVGVRLLDSAGLVASNLVIAGACFLAVRLAFALAPLAHDAPVPWLPAGIALAAVVLGGARLQAGVTFGALAGHLDHGSGPVAAAGAALATAVEAQLGAVLLDRFGFKPRLRRVRDVLLLGVIACGASSAAGALLEALAACASGAATWDRLPTLAGNAWLGHALACLVLAPLLLTWAVVRKDEVRGPVALDGLVGLLAVCVASGF